MLEQDLPDSGVLEKGLKYFCKPGSSNVIMFEFQEFDFAMSFQKFSQIFGTLITNIFFVHYYAGGLLELIEEFSQRHLNFDIIVLFQNKDSLKKQHEGVYNYNLFGFYAMNLYGMCINIFN